MGSGAVLLPPGGNRAHAGSPDQLDFSAVGGVWRSLAARFVRDEEAAGSNPATPTQVKGHSPRREVAFFDPYSSEVQQRLRIELLAEALERLERLGVRDLGVNVHCDVDLRMPQDAHGDARVDVERG